MTSPEDRVGHALSAAEARIPAAGIGQDILPILEERATVEKAVVNAGRVRVATHTTLVEEIATATLEGQEVDVTRVPIGKAITGALPQIRTEGDLTIVPVFEEVVFVEKRLMLKEEIHIRRRTTAEQVEMPVQLRKQEAKVERSET